MNAKMKQEILRELDEHLIPFWEGLRDETHGGFYGYLSYDLELEVGAEKGCILNSRILWFFSEAYLYFRKQGQKQAEQYSSQQGQERADLLANADHAYTF